MIANLIYFPTMNQIPFKKFILMMGAITEGIWCPYEEWGMEVGWPPFGNKPITTSMSIGTSTNYISLLTSIRRGLWKKDLHTKKRN